MFKPKREKPTATTALEKTNPQKPSIQAEGELTEAQLEAIAGGVNSTYRWSRDYNVG
ncbi:MAG: hypothetical protein QNJ72_03905 [Pleurocapsa sp. MO_226.B13]|nr:hypothetical protein [Pleurocapsa sp. MO_226.B13]